MKKITQLFYRVKSFDKTVHVLPKFFLLVMMCSQMGWGQQVIGSFPVMDGGFEGQTATTAIGGVPAAGNASTTWTLDSNSNTTVRSIINNSSVARSGNKYISHTTTSTKYLQSPSATALANNTKYIVQYWLKSTTATSTYVSVASIWTATGTKVTANGTFVGTYAASTWMKVTAVVSLGTFTSTLPAPYAGMKTSNTDCLYDDFVVYAADDQTTPIADTTAPDSPTNLVVASGDNPLVSWTASADVDGGGYVVVRYASSPDPANDPLPNSIFAKGNTTNGLTGINGIVAYIGTATSFTDTVPAGSYYKVYTVDKAFNYSNEITGSAVAAGTTPQAITFGALSSVTYGDAAFALTATADSSLAVTYASSNTAVATVSGSTVTIVGTGSTNITASQSGDTTYAAATPQIQPLTVNTKTLTIPDAAAQNKGYDGTTAAVITGTLTGIVNSDDVTLNATGTFVDENVGTGKIVTSTSTLGGTKSANYSLTQPTGLTANIMTGNQTINLAATAYNYINFTDYTPLATSATSGANPITYTSSNSSVATIVGNKVHYVGLGTTTITASQAGNANYNAATDATQILTVVQMPIAAWNFWTASSSSQTTKQAYIFDSGLTTASSADNITRGAGAPASSGTSAFRTIGFPLTSATPTLITNNSTSYYQVTIQANVGKTVSISTIDANFYTAGASGSNVAFENAPGATSQFGYSLDGGTTVVPIGSPVTSTSLRMGQIDVSGISALQNVPASTKIILRYYASGQSTTRGWGFGSPNSGGTAGVAATDGLVIGGSVSSAATTWNGSAWSNGTPDATLEAIIAGTYNTKLVVDGGNGTFIAKKLTINSGSITVNSGTNLTVTNEVVNNAGVNGIVIENNANLIQTNNVVNTGNAVVNKNSNPLYRSDYTMWSSPTGITQKLNEFSPLTTTGRFYEYNSGTNKYNAVADATPFSLGKGFLIRMPNTDPTTGYDAGTATLAYPGVFTGVLNNGDVNITGTSGQYVAVGNPYPSTISADAFIDANSAGSGAGTLYFWRKTNGIGSTAYATYTKAGPVGVPAGSGTANGGFTPTADIAVGQGFITTVPTLGVVTFTNALRTSSNSAQLMKTKAPAQKDRVWINLSAGTNPVNQILVAYMDGATTGVDAGIDGAYINDAPTALTSDINGGEYTIQGRPAFDASDIVNLNFKAEVAGDYTIAKDHTDGVFASGQDVYLVDSTTGKETNLQTDAYTFTAAAGASNSRFKLTYKTSAALNVNNLTFDENAVSVYKQNGVLNINAGKITIKSVKVFDISGRLIFEQNVVNTNTTTLKNLAISKQALLIQITSNENKVVTKKVVY